MKFTQSCARISAAQFSAILLWLHLPRLDLLSFNLCKTTQSLVTVKSLSGFAIESVYVLLWELLETLCANRSKVWCIWSPSQGLSLSFKPLLNDLLSSSATNSKTWLHISHSIKLQVSAQKPSATVCLRPRAKKFYARKVFPSQFSDRKWKLLWVWGFVLACNLLGEHANDVVFL